LDSNWFVNVATQNTATLNIQGNKIRYNGGTNSGAAARALFADGNGNPLSLKNVKITFKLDFISQFSQNNTATTRLRRSDTTSWRGTAWNEFPDGYNDWGTWGWCYGTGEHHLGAWNNGSLAYDVPTYPGDPVVGNTYIHTHIINNNGNHFTRELATSPFTLLIDKYGWNTIHPDAGYLGFGFGGPYVIDVYDIQVTDLQESLDLISASDSSSFSTSAELNVWRYPTIGADSSALDSNWFSSQTQASGTCNIQGNKIRIDCGTS